MVNTVSTREYKCMFGHITVSLTKRSTTALRDESKKF